MQIDLVGPFQSLIYIYALSGIVVFSKCLLAVQLTLAHAGSVSKALISMCFQYSYLPTAPLPDLGQSLKPNYDTN